MNIQRRACYAFAVAAFFGLSAGAHAETQWDRDHPSHDQVKDHKEHHAAAVHAVPARDVHQDHGHVTRPEEHAVDHKEHDDSHEIVH